MINTRKLTDKQLQLVKEIIRLAGGRTILARKEIKEMHGQLRGAHSSPYFIAKNIAAKAKGKDASRGSYDLGIFIKYAKDHPMKKEAKPRKEVAAVATKKPVRKATAKKTVKVKSAA